MQSFVYELPFGAGKRWLQSGPVNWILGGWQVSGIFSAYSGLPLNITISGTSLNSPGNGNRPNMSGKPDVTGNIGVGQKYFDVAKFSPPPANTFGNVGRNILNGPKLVNLDAALFKKFPITEKVSGEFRAESFNVTNSPHFNNPSGDFSGTSFGEVTSAFDQRQFQFALKFVF